MCKMEATQEKELEELKSKFYSAQTELDAFDSWFNTKKGLLNKKICNEGTISCLSEAEFATNNKNEYRQELHKFLENRKKFCKEDGTCNKGILFYSQAEFAFALFLELLKIDDFQTQTYIQDGQVDFFIPRLKLIIEIDGQTHYLGYKYNSHLDKEETLKKI